MISKESSLLPIVRVSESSEKVAGIDHFANVVSLVCYTFSYHKNTAHTFVRALKNTKEI